MSRHISTLPILLKKSLALVRSLEKLCEGATEGWWRKIGKLPMAHMSTLTSDRRAL